MKVFVYFNLRRKCWSVKALNGNHKGRVIAHAREVLIRDATFKVSEAGRQRVIRERRKHVHAGVVGTLEAMRGCDLTSNGRSCPMAAFHADFGFDRTDNEYRRFAVLSGDVVVYNPYLYETFVTIKPDGSEPCHAAEMAYLRTNVGKGAQVFAFDPCTMPEGQS